MPLSAVVACHVCVYFCVSVCFAFGLHILYQVRTLTPNTIFILLAVVVSIVVHTLCFVPRLLTKWVVCFCHLYVCTLYIMFSLWPTHTASSNIKLVSFGNNMLNYVDNHYSYCIFSNCIRNTLCLNQGPEQLYLFSQTSIFNRCVFTPIKYTSGYNFWFLFY